MYTSPMSVERVGTISGPTGWYLSVQGKSALVSRTPHAWTIHESKGTVRSSSKLYLHFNAVQVTMTETEQTLTLQKKENKLVITNTSVNKTLDFWDVQHPELKVYNTNGDNNQQWTFEEAVQFEGNNYIRWPVSKPNGYNKKLHPVYFCLAVQSSSLPTLLIPDKYFKFLQEQTHEGAFGNDFKVTTFQGVRYYRVWKWPGDMFDYHKGTHITGLAASLVSGIPLPVGTYPLRVDNIGSLSITPVENFPLNDTVTKWRVAGVGHYLENSQQLRCAALSTVPYFYKDFESKPTSKQTKTVLKLCQTLNAEFQLQVFPCHNQHHVLVFYSLNGALCTPSVLAGFIKTTPAFNETLVQFTKSSLGSWSVDYQNHHWPEPEPIPLDELTQYEADLLTAALETVQPHLQTGMIFMLVHIGRYGSHGSKYIAVKPLENPRLVTFTVEIDGSGYGDHEAQLANKVNPQHTWLMCGKNFSIALDQLDTWAEHSDRLKDWDKICWSGDDRQIKDMVMVRQIDLLVEQGQLGRNYTYQILDNHYYLLETTDPDLFLRVLSTKSKSTVVKIRLMRRVYTQQLTRKIPNEVISSHVAELLLKTGLTEQDIGQVEVSTFNLFAKQMAELFPRLFQRFQVEPPRSLADVLKQLVLYNAANNTWTERTLQLPFPLKLTRGKKS